MASYNRYTGSGATAVYRDIVDDLFYITQNETPIMDMAKNVEAKDQKHEWTEVLYAAVTQNNYKRADGADLTSTYTPPAKTVFENYVEESAIPFDVSKRSAAIGKRGGYAGPNDQWAKAKTEAMVVLKDNVEWAILNGTKASGDSSNPSQMDGLLTLAEDKGTASHTATVASGEADFRALLQTMRGNGGMRGRKKMLFTSYPNRDLIGANWKGNATETNTMSKEAKIYADVKVYVSPHGPIMVEGHDMCADTDLVIFDAEDLNLAWLYNTTTIELGRTGLQENVAAVANAVTLEYTKPSTLGYLEIS